MFKTPTRDTVLLAWVKKILDPRFKSAYSYLLLFLKPNIASSSSFRPLALTVGFVIGFNMSFCNVDLLDLANGSTSRSFRTHEPIFPTISPIFPLPV